jgi:integrase
MKEDMKKDDKTSRLMRSKTDQRYWLDRLRKRVRKVKDSQLIDPDFSIQIALGNKKERVKLATANKSEAAARAASFYRSLVADGWEAAYAAHEFSRAGRRGKNRDAATEGELQNHTLGALFSAYEKVTNTRSSTLSAYKKALRKIYSEIGEINGAGRFKTATTGNRVWKEKVDQLPLTTVTSESLQEWKQLQFRTDFTLDEKRARAITINSLLRNARSVFAKKHRPLLLKHVMLPDPVPFDDVRLESSPTPRYRSRIDARAILASADEELRELQPVLYAALNLALRSGLRRREIDTLMWKSVDLERKVIHVEANEHYDLKSTDSAGEVDIGDEFVKFLKSFRKQHEAESFVIPVVIKRRKRKTHSSTADSAATSHSYRCMKVFEDLTAWLRSHGVESKRPIHELRKEVGSLIADEHGIYAASRFMRHADIRITAASYLDKKKRIVAPI